MTEINKDIFAMPAFVVNWTACCLAAAGFMLQVSSRHNLSPALGYIIIAAGWLVGVTGIITCGWLYNA